MLRPVHTLAGVVAIIGVASVSIAAMPQRSMPADGSPALHAAALGSLANGSSRFEPCMCPICMQFRSQPAPVQQPTLGATTISITL